MSASECEFAVHIRQSDNKDIKKDVLAHQLYVLATKPPFNRCYQFLPKKVDAYDRAREYGLHEGDQMVKYFIILMAESFEELQAMKVANNKRLIMPQRRSVGPVAEPFSDYIIINKNEIKILKEKALAKDDKKSAVLKARKGVKDDQNDKILAKFSGKMKANDNALDKTPIELSPSSNDKRDATENLSNSVSADRTLDEEQTQKFQPCELCGPEVAKLQAQLDMALTSSENMCVKYDELKKERDLLKRQLDKQSDKINEINDKLTKLPDQMRSMQKENCWLLNLKDHKVVPIEKEFKDVTMPVGCYYIGKGKFVHGGILGPCADYDTMRKRVEALCDAFFGDDLPFMSPSGKRGKYGAFLPKIIKIENCHYTAMQVVLKAMPWNDVVEKERKKNTSVSMKAGVRKYTMEKCIEYVKENHPAEYQRIESENKSNKKEKEDCDNDDDEESDDNGKRKKKRKLGEETGENGKGRKDKERKLEREEEEWSSEEYGEGDNKTDNIYLGNLDSFDGDSSLKKTDNIYLGNLDSFDGDSR